MDTGTRVGDERRDEPPVLLVVDGAADDLRLVARALERRFGADYAVRPPRAPRRPSRRWRGSRARRRQVALVAADAAAAGDGRRRAHPARPRAPSRRRAGAVRRDGQRGGDGRRHDPRPPRLGARPDRLFDPQGVGLAGGVALPPGPGGAERVDDRAPPTPRARADRRRAVVAAEPRAPRPAHPKHDAVRVLRARTRRRAGGCSPRTASTASRLPVAILFDGKVLVDPDNARARRRLRRPDASPSAERYDVAIVGAGPAGLAAAVYARLGGAARRSSSSRARSAAKRARARGSATTSGSREA